MPFKSYVAKYSAILVHKRLVVYYYTSTSLTSTQATCSRDRLPLALAVPLPDPASDPASEPATDPGSASECQWLPSRLPRPGVRLRATCSGSLPVSARLYCNWHWQCTCGACSTNSTAALRHKLPMGLPPQYKSQASRRLSQTLSRLPRKSQSHHHE